MALSKIDVANMLTGLVPNDNTIRRKNAKPLIVNGSMEISQRGTSFTSNGYTLDRFTFDESTDGAVTVTQDSTVPTGQGFAKSVKFDVTTADGTLASNQYCQWTQFIEGQNLQLLKYGTSSAENLTLAFWVRSNKTGTYGVRFVKEAGGQTRYECPIIYTIDSADTWEKKVINLSPTAGSTSLITGAAGAIVNSNASGYRIAWILASGSDYHATNNTWVAASDKFTTSAQANLLDNTSNELYITGIQLEVGEYTSTTLPPFQHESFEDNLKRCQRYYIAYVSGNNELVGSGIAYASNQANVPIHFPTTMRTNPSLDADTGTDYYKALGTNSSGNGYVETFNAFIADRAHENASGVFINTSDGFSGTSGNGFYMCTNNDSASIAFDAEL